MTDTQHTRRLANAIRALAMDAVEQANSGHPGMPMGMADVATVLFTKVLKYDASAPHWPDRDRFILSAGHGSMLLYALLHLTGSKEMTIDELKRFRQVGSRTPGHPERGHTESVETTTGPLGAGISNAVGLALAERILAARYPSITDHRTFAICSDGDLMEGISQEAIAIAGHLKLNRLVFLWDDNGISIDGELSLSDSVDQLARFKACGWNAVRVDGHDPEAIEAALKATENADKPTLIACKTVIGFGAPTKAGSEKAHGSPLGKDEIAGARKALGWEYGPFEIPDDVRSAWAEAGLRGKAARRAWEDRFEALEPAVRDEYERRLHGDLPEGFSDAMAAYKAKLYAEPKEVATRKAGEAALAVVSQALPELVSGSADLTPSNNTFTKNMKAITPGDYSGDFVHWGIREHGMAGAVNGLAIHGGVLPVGSTFLVFSDYCRPSLRLAALMKLRVVQVFTHDSIGVGEDGPTHQPVEHVASLRAIPNLNVFRPADAVETAEAWEIAVASKERPSVFALTRQNLPQLRLQDRGENLTAKGGYELAAAEGTPAVSLFATGSEVSLAMEAKAALDAAGLPTRVVSLPCFELFFDQPASYRAEVIGTAPVKIAIEAAIRMGWDAIVGSDGGFVGMHGFGESGPYKEVYKTFGITADAVVELAKARSA
ncbi:transketolase [Methylopila jiangsuensis]|uniref:Transketolase n=1 Tax=Methylopila jiangsuensis TaxID=586230 RepID=A0A9W6JK65_9HYPH|nr:transketolase [Methylopila jiangsuensis]MDR6286438.1 transketolase [Methylopila jiangsuensis]GLK77224.1 transketolase [Methylopila jiangsuensis]